MIHAIIRYVSTLHWGPLWTALAISVALVLTLNDVDFKSLKSILNACLRAFLLTTAIVLGFTLYTGIASSLGIMNQTLGQQIIQIVLTLGYTLLFSKYNFKVKILVCGALLSSSIILNEFGGALGIIVQDNYGIESAYMRAFATVFTVIFAFFIRKLHIKQFGYIATNTVVLMISMETLCLAISMLRISFHMLLWDYKEYIAITFFLLYVMCVLSYFLLFFICKEQSYRIRTETEKEIYIANSELLSVVDKDLAEIRKFRHDLKNQYLYMSVMLEDGKLEELKKFLLDMSDDLVKKIKHVDCGNGKLNAILNMEISKAKTKGVKIRSQITIPKTLPFSDIDVFSLFTNLIDNAIEGVERYNIKNGEIGVNVYTQGDYMCAVIRNPVPKSVDKVDVLKFESRKNQDGVHGFGVGIIKEIVKKYNGAAVFDIEDGCFEARVMLDLNYNAKGIKEE